MFWLLHILCSLPFCARGAKQERTPLAYFAVIVLLTIIPIVFGKLRAIPFSTASVAGEIVMGPRNSHYLYRFPFSVGGIVFSGVISRNHITLLEKPVQCSTQDALPFQ